MNKLLKLLFSLTIALVATACPAGEVFKLNPKTRLIKVIGAIDSNVLQTAYVLHTLEKKTTPKVHIQINSPGGQIDTGFILIDAVRAVKSRGIKVECSVGFLAASMAFILMAECDDVYVLPNALLLFHQPAVTVMMSRLTRDSALQLAQDLNRLQAPVDVELIKYLGLPAELYYQHNSAETLWQADDLIAVLREYATNSIALERLHLVDRFDGLNPMEGVPPPDEAASNKKAGVKRIKTGGTDGTNVQDRQLIPGRQLIPTYE